MIYVGFTFQKAATVGGKLPWWGWGRSSVVEFIAATSPKEDSFEINLLFKLLPHQLLMPFDM